MRVWLTQWEWACCGTPFTVGDQVAFNVAGRHPSPELAKNLGAEITATVDVIESHHEGEFPEHVSGVVVAIHSVSLEYEQHTTLRRPGHGAPPDAVMPADGEEWPQRVTELGGGVTMRSQPSRYITQSIRRPGTAQLTSTRGVRIPDEKATTAATANDVEHRSLEGWLVDLSPATSSSAGSA